MTETALYYKPGGQPIYNQSMWLKLDQARKDHSSSEEAGVVCGRFPHMPTCACEIDCSLAIKQISLFEVYNGIFMGPFQAAFKTQELIDSGITHILNVTCKSYTLRNKFFKYYNLQIQDVKTEDAKRHFRATNRFIQEALDQGGKVLVQSVDGRSRAATFVLAYMIHTDRMQLKECLNILRQYVPEAEPNEGFMSQLAQYDLELLQKNE